MDFSDRVDRRVIPTGGWQRIVGGLAALFGVFTAIAAEPGNGAGAASVIFFAIGGSLLFWGQMLRYFSILEEKMAFMIAGYTEEDEGDEAEA